MFRRRKPALPAPPVPARDATLPPQDADEPARQLADVRAQVAADRDKLLSNLVEIACCLGELHGQLAERDRQAESAATSGR